MAQTKRQKQVAALHALERRVTAVEADPRGHIYPHGYVQARKAEIEELRAKLGHLLPHEEAPSDAH